jgi:tetratricopeptide (TPR) repeat protein
MKKYVVIIFTLAIILTGCGSSKKQLQRGNYDAAIATAVKELRRNPDNEKQVDILERSYTVVNEQDNEKIRYLKMENRPQNWDEIYLAYKRMNDRQSLVRTVMPLNSGGRSIELPYVDYMPEMVNAKRKSADYYYAHGVELMKTGIKENYRQAYAEFIRAKDYVGDYEDIDNKIREAKYLGMSRIFVSLQNSTMIVFPKDFEEDLLTVDLQALNNEWVEYHLMNLDENVNYDYYINVNVRNIAVSPDRTEERDSIIKRDIEDGFTYQLDKKGNVMKDTLGNDIKVKKYKTLQCALVSTLQTKSCRIDGDIEIIQMNPKNLLKKDPIGAQSTFEYVSARAIGDIEALSPAQLERTKVQAIPFPTDLEMVLRCSESLKQAIRGSIQSNRRLII